MRNHFCIFACEKAKLVDSNCMHLRWRKAIFDNPFTRLKYILCSPLLSLINFSWKITLARITPYTGGQVPKKKSLMIESAQITLGGMKNLNDWKCPNNTRGYKRKFSINRRCPYKAGGMKKKSKWSKNFEQKKKKSQCNDAQNQMKKTKTKRKSPSQTLGGTVDHFINQFQGPEMYEQKKVWDTSTSDP